MWMRICIDKVWTRGVEVWMGDGSVDERDGKRLRSDDVNKISPRVLPTSDPSFLRSRNV